METSYDNLPKQVDFLISELAVIKELFFERIKKPEEVPKYLDGEKALLFLREKGYIISKSKLYKLTSSKGIPCHKIENKLFFYPKELDQWFENLIKEQKCSCFSSNLSIIKSAQNKK